MDRTQRNLLVAVVVAAVLGFAAGWLARTWSEPTIEERAHDTVRGAEKRLHDFLH